MMDHQRFEQLVAAYGADPARWPAQERAEAERLVAGADLAEARALDAALDAFRVEAPSLALRQRILATAPRPRGGRLFKPGGFRPSGVFWLSGASLAAACAVGVIAGVSLGGALATTSAQADRDADASAAFEAVTVFGSPIDVGHAG
ncbi:MAG: hypothetical protein P4L73_16410 [Caulobacteraceae bacterium]|nr:hypothetical protein [Caulobacteraceae bacterium]